MPHWGGYMFLNKFSVKIIAILTVVIALVSCSEEVTAQPKNSTLETLVLDVYKSPTCSCCEKWISHINENGIETQIHNYQNFSVIKDKKGIEPRYRSCHTSISQDGYAFEGHIPAKFIQNFLSEVHADDIIGLSVPAMPSGTPGMEMVGNFQPYKVLLLKKDGSFEVFANVESYEEQF